MLADGGAQTTLYAAVNGIAWAAGLALAGLLLFVPVRAPRWFALAAALALLATAIFGGESEGVRRWVMAGGGMQLHPAFLLLPLLLCSYARRAHDVPYAGAVMIAALAVAIMPDWSMAMPLAMVSALVWLLDRTPLSALVMGTALLALLVTWLRPDSLMGVEHVEQVLQAGWQDGPLTGAALSFGALAMLAPCLMLRAAQPLQRRSIMAFTVIWGLLLLCSLVGAYPTPLLGYGASAIIGYFLSVIALRNPASLTESP